MSADQPAATPRLASCSSGFLRTEGYPCRHLWPADCYVQCGGGGIVLGPTPYRTAFFEAFPREPKTFLRGEGDTIEAAEAACWAQWERILACPGHDFDRRSRRDGYAWCRHCGLSGMHFEPLDHCVVCATPTAYGRDAAGAWHCETHYQALPLDRLPSWAREARELRERLAAGDPGVSATDLLVAHLALESVLDAAVDTGRSMTLDDVTSATTTLLQGGRRPAGSTSSGAGDDAPPQDV